MKLNRRQFVKGAAIGFPSLFIPKWLDAQPSMRNPTAGTFSRTNPPSGGGGGGTGCDSVNSSNLVSWWRLDETSGTRADTKGTNNLSDSGSTASATGLIGNCASFAGATALSIASNATLSMAAKTFSFGALVNINALDGNFYGIISKNSEYVGYVNSSNQLTFLTNGGSGFGSTLSYTGAGFTAGVWHHVLFVFDSTGGTSGFTGAKYIYLDGEQVATTNVDNFSATADAFVIGGLTTAAWGFKGKIDEPFITKDRLTATDSSNLYNGALGCRPTGV